jgi:hypothetical protein
MIDLHAFLLQSPNTSRASRSLKALVKIGSHAFPNTSQVLKAEGVSVQFKTEAGKPRRLPIQPIRTPNCLVAVIREHLQHYKNTSTKSTTHSLTYHSVKEQAHVFANAFTQTFPQLRHNSAVCALLATTLQEFPRGLPQQLPASKNAVPQYILALQKKIATMTGKRCRVSDH